MKVSSHTSKYRGVIVTIEKHQDHDGGVSLYATIDGQVFHPVASDSFNSILKECQAQIDRRINEQQCLPNVTASALPNLTGYCMTAFV